MRVALIDANPGAHRPPLALLKLGTHLRIRGDACELFTDALPPPGAFDEIWLSAVFSYHIPRVRTLAAEALRRCERVLLGGISPTLFPDVWPAGVEVHRGLLPEVERLPPAYDLLHYDPAYSIVHTSRGCPRGCGFCMVGKLEPEFSVVEDWPARLHPTAPAVQFYDNNWLAKPPGAVDADIERMRDLQASGRVRVFDFNQGIDARLFTAQRARTLRGLKIDPLRFALDSWDVAPAFEAAVGHAVENGFKKLRNYVLYNYHDNPRDFYARLELHAKLAERHGVTCEAFPMRYVPITAAPHARQHVGPHWTRQTRSAVMRIIGHDSFTGMCAHRTVAEFHYWYGSTADEFERLLVYPQLSKLLKLRKERLRHRQRKLRGVS